MKSIFHKSIVFLFGALLLFVPNVFGQSTDIMYTEGKIYTVIAVLITILAGLIVLVIRLDKKVGKLEKELEKIQMD